MKTMTTKVQCSVCGKILRAHEGVVGGWHVRAHKDGATGRPCWGARRTNHKKVSDT